MGTHKLIITKHRTLAAPTMCYEITVLVCACTNSTNRTNHVCTIAILSPQYNGIQHKNNIFVHLHCCFNKDYLLIVIHTCTCTYM